MALAANGTAVARMQRVLAGLVLRPRCFGAAAVPRGDLQCRGWAEQQRPVHRVPGRLVVLDGLAQSHAVLPGHGAAGTRPGKVRQLRRGRAAAAPWPAQLLSLQLWRLLSGGEQRRALVPCWPFWQRDRPLSGGGVPSMPVRALLWHGRQGGDAVLPEYLRAQLEHLCLLAVSNRKLSK